GPRGGKAHGGSASPREGPHVLPRTGRQLPPPWCPRSRRNQVRVLQRTLVLFLGGCLGGGAPRLAQAQATPPALTLGSLYRQLDAASPQLTAARASARAASFRIAP